MSPSISVAAIVVTYNRPEALSTTISSLLGQSRRPDEILIVDNSPERSATDVIRGLPVKLLCAGANLGYAGGLIAGIAHLSGRDWDYFWFLDDDSPVGEHSLEEGLATLSCLPRLSSLATRGAMVRWKGIEPVRPSREPMEVDVSLVDGGLFPPSAIASAGGLRDDLFMMFEDYDLTSRMRRAGFPVFVSTAVRSDAMHIGTTSAQRPWRSYYQTRNHVRSAIDQRDVKLLVSGISRTAKQMAHLASPGAQKRREATHTRFLGLYDALRGRMGRTIVP